MAKPTLPLLALLMFAVPAAASAQIIRADLRDAAPVLIQIDDDDDDDDDRRRHRRHRRYEQRDYRQDRRDERQAYRQGRRDGRREAREHQYYQPGDYDGGYRQQHRRYSRGQYLPPEYRGYVVNDYNRYGYPPPPRGCRYVQVGGNTYLTQVATGLILNVFLGGGYQ